MYIGRYICKYTEQRMQICGGCLMSINFIGIDYIVYKTWEIIIFIIIYKIYMF